MVKKQEKYIIKLDSKDNYLLKDNTNVLFNMVLLRTKKFRFIGDFIKRNDLTLYKHRTNKLYYVKRLT